MQTVANNEQKPHGIEKTYINTNISILNMLPYVVLKYLMQKLTFHASNITLEQPPPGHVFVWRRTEHRNELLGTQNDTADATQNHQVFSEKRCEKRPMEPWKTTQKIIR
jgi:hypothetical protein